MHSCLAKHLPHSSLDMDFSTMGTHSIGRYSPVFGLSSGNDTPSAVIYTYPVQASLGEITTIALSKKVVINNELFKMG